MTAQLQGLSGIPGVTETFNSFIQTVRLFMRDYPQLNRLTKGEESSDRMIAWAILDFLSDFSTTPPPLGSYTLDSLFEMGYQHLALRGTVTALLQSVGLLATRNSLQFNDSGLVVNLDKSPQLMGWIRDFMSKYEQLKVQVKVSMNIQQLLGLNSTGVHSELYFVNGWYGF
jgi:hypothetical protein